MSDNANVIDPTVDNETETVDATTEPTTVETNNTPTGKSKSKEFINSLKGKLDEKDQAIEDLRNKMQELETSRLQDIARAKYWDDVVDNETVQGYVSKWLSYDEAMKLADIAPKPSYNQYAMTWWSTNNIKSDVQEISYKQLEDLKNSNPLKYEEMLNKVINKEVVYKA